MGETDILQRKNRRGTGILKGKIEGEIGTLERERTGILERENRGRIREGGYRQGDTYCIYEIHGTEEKYYTQQEEFFNPNLDG